MKKPVEQKEMQHLGDAKTSKNEAVSLSPGLLSADLTAKYLSIGKTLLHQLDLAGQIPQAIHLRGRKLWRRCELEAWIACGCPSRDRWQYERQDMERI